MSFEMLKLEQFKDDNKGLDVETENAKTQKPEEPEEPEKPEEPKDPEEPENRNKPEEHEEYEEPEEPEEPEETEEQEEPGAAEETQEHNERENHEEPDEQEDPEDPEDSTEPGEPDQSDEFAEPEEPEAMTEVDTDLIPDYLTPTLILVGVNIVLPSLDLYRDITMMTRLFNIEYIEHNYLWIGFLFLCLLINFFFTSLTWWRLDTPQDKRWSWLLLLLQVWPQSRAVWVIWLTWTGNPKASQEKAKLDREVGGLEPFLEAMPTAFAAYYLAYYRYSNNDMWKVIGGWNTFYSGIFSLSLAVSLFLKGGPCAILASRGPLAGMLTPSFLVLYLSVICSIMSKIINMHWSPQIFVTYTVCICGSSLLLSLTALRNALGSWRASWKIGTSYPAILLLPMFTYFTFGAYRDEGGEVGLVLSWKWTLTNMLLSVMASFIKVGLHLPLYESTVQCIQIVNPEYLFNVDWIASFVVVAIGFICASVLFTLPES